MSLNKNSVYCVMPRSSKPPDTCKWGRPKLRGILKFSPLPFFQDRDAWCRVQFVWSKYNLHNMSELILTGVLCSISGWIFDWTVRYSVFFLSITEFTIQGFYCAIFHGLFWDRKKKPWGIIYLKCQIQNDHKLPCIEPKHKEAKL